jgi:mannan endo-1,4-beta-mannosidase
LVPWWTHPTVLPVLKRHARYLIINLANELGGYRWLPGGAQEAALTNFKQAYKAAISTIRNAGLNMPIMIDAPDGGTAIDVLTAVGAELINHDPRRSLLLSAHAYWAGYNGRPEVDKAFDAKLPLVFGEVANKQDEVIDGNTQYCYYDLDGTGEGHTTSTKFRYQSLLVYLTQLEVGWLAWSWWKDGCAGRQMTPNGNYPGGYAGLTTYGDDLLHHATYGMRTGYFSTKRTGSLPGLPPA